MVANQLGLNSQSPCVVLLRTPETILKVEPSHKLDRPQLSHVRLLF